MKTSSCVLLSSTGLLVLTSEVPCGFVHRHTHPSQPRPRTAAVPVRRTRLFALPEMRWAAAALVLFLAGLAAQLLGGPEWLWWTLYLACYVTGGWEPGLAGLKALRDKTFDVDLLMVVAAIGAAAIGQVMDGGAADRHLRHLRRAGGTGHRAHRGLRARAAGSGSRHRDPAHRRRRRGDRARPPIWRSATWSLVRPGERIAADGAVVDGASEVDQATITGEPLPVDKTAGDEVFAGTLNGTGSLRVRVDRRAEDSVVARIAALVEEASQTKAKTQLFIEKVEQRYSVGMVAATIAVFVVPLLWGDALQDVAAAGDDVHDRRVPVRGGAGDDAAAAGRDRQRRAPRRAGEVRGGDGTARHHHAGRVRQDRHPDPRHPRTRRDPHPGPAARFTEEQLLRLAAAAEHPSEHPLAAAIVRAARARGLRPARPPTSSPPSPAGASRRWSTDHFIQVGSPALLASAGTTRHARPQAAVDALQERGHTAVVVLCERPPGRGAGHHRPGPRRSRRHRRRASPG